MSHESFVALLEEATELVPRPAFEALFERTLAEVLRMTAGRRVGYAWSGGKDSIALEVVMTEAGITDCCFGMTDLEYQQFLVWVTDNMPPGLEVFNNGWDLAWLRAHPQMLFPATDMATRWFAGVQHKAQQQFSTRRGLDLLITGRRRDDGNYVPGADGTYEARGVRRYAPLRDWTHADVFACLIYHGRIDNMPPFYRWPRGYRVGTHAWPARQWCASRAAGFAEVWSIEADRVREAAAAGVADARDWMQASGLS